MKIAQQPHHVMILRRGRQPAPAQPVEQIGIGAFEQRFIAIELTRIEQGKVNLGKAAQNKVAFARPTMPGPEQEPLAADIGRDRQQGALGGVASGI
jgi:hypothetical protein